MLFLRISCQKAVVWNLFCTNDVVKAIRHYECNLMLAESLYVSLSVLEVALRNYYYRFSFCNISTNSFSLSTNSCGNVMSRSTLKCESSDTM